MKIAFKGQRGSYAEAAAAEMFRDRDIATIPVRSAMELIQGVESGEYQFGVMRLEFGNWGLNHNAIDLVRSRNLKFVRQTEFHEIYNLAGGENVNASDLESIYANPTIINICDAWCEAQTEIEIMARFDSERMFHEVLERKSSNEAIICGDFACSIYNLKIIESGVESSADSLTRFIAITSSETEFKNDDNSFRTSILFDLRHEPGALMHALASFHKNNVNLRVVDCRPDASRNGAYAIYVEFDGGQNESDIADALDGLEKGVDNMRILGSYDLVEARKWT